MYTYFGKGYKDIQAVIVYCTLWHACVGQRTIFDRWFLGIKLRSSGRKFPTLGHFNGLGIHFSDALLCRPNWTVVSS